MGSSATDINTGVAITDEHLNVKRKCLKCQKMFNSQHIGNRVCVKCNQMNINSHNIGIAQMDSPFKQSGGYQF